MMFLTDAEWLAAWNTAGCSPRAMAKATGISEFVRHYPFGLSPALDELWLRAAAWAREAPPVPRAEDSEPYPRHGA